MFYLAFLLPVEIERGGAGRGAALGQGDAGADDPGDGFASDQWLGHRRQAGAGVPGAGATFLTAWLQYFLIVLMASSTASVIGVDEVVSRANRVIATDQRPVFLMVTYGYVALWFLAAGVAVSVAASGLAQGCATAGGVGWRPAQDETELL